MKLLIKFPTRERKDKFFRVLDLYYNLLEDPNNTSFFISMDVDDLTMNNERVKELFKKYKNLKYFYGNNKTKIEAINADMEKVDEWDIVLLASDDMIPKVKGYDRIIRNKMDEFYPDTDGILWFYDGNRRDLNTLCILGKKYYDRFNYIYFPQYKSFCSDNEFQHVGEKLGKQTFINEMIIKHEHPDIPQFSKEFDVLYHSNQRHYHHDAMLYNERLKNNFGM